MTEAERQAAWDAVFTINSVVSLAIVVMDDLELEAPRNVDLFCALRAVLRDANPKLETVMLALDRNVPHSAEH
ncbi:hypothetical protein HRR99_19630 [Agrobacterium vaccinii]|uniref:hypothetical protein n=1 Tax=Agrobacterium vaccinii TaxID=2735528 RepID=UPI001E4FC1E8|nr:hypothetical protein [Agrobacterium vaccinii]UHS63764.1 hypothetical protein HRR99_19630 [Agrobacterium vaccinii]